MSKTLKTNRTQFDFEEDYFERRGARPSPKPRGKPKNHSTEVTRRVRNRHRGKDWESWG